ncbi:tyrosine-type recombinase/integrase [Salinigranum halophilum]|uniref:tyrosine-type recombinase/integrase n=1 Tax=Salinigranum halophilum TaxID=2565931 RepID=UPI00115D4D3C|nr:site-specific integrase [Salinigranum halophilum]
MTDRRRVDPRDLSPRDARDRYLRRRRTDSTEESISGWYYRLKLFAEWCDSVGIERVGELRGYDLDEYYELRSSEIAPATLEGEMWALKMFCRFLEDIEAVDDGLAKKVRIPDLDPEDRSNDTALSTPAALALVDYYRNDGRATATRAHVFIELAWFVGARQSGIRALDVRDFHPENDYLEFRHRPESGTGLKNKRDGERSVAIPPESSSAIARYIRENRYDVRDDHGRQPLLASMKGRPGTNTVRCWSYLATEPCLHGECPHGKERETCEWAEYAHASKCPSSRSPHQIRTGSITWQLNQGVPPEVVAERVNASVKTIKQHYDTATVEQRRQRQLEYMERRRHHLDKLDFGSTEDDSDE